MSRILSILRAVHCRSTHHYFALDALGLVDTVPGERLSRLLLQHYSAYLAGAKAPDSSFRDFQNHVLHVADGNWGGAPQACEKWLKQAIEHLDRRQWKQAAFACGVLSHYFTDPLMPLHTSQSERESVVHRPLEWSIFKAYEAIARSMSELQLKTKLHFSHGPDWISKAVVAGAHVAHQHYDRLIAIYDLQQGVRDPAAGLNAEARAILAELFSVAHTGWAHVLCRIADETTVEIPACSLTLASLFATIDIPLSLILKKFSDATERRAVAAIFEEYAGTGTLRRHLPSEIQVVQKHRQLSLDADGLTMPAPLAPAKLDSTTRRVETPAMANRDDRRTRRLDSIAIDPLAVDPLAVEPLAVDPLAVDPLAVDPLAVDPNSALHQATAVFNEQISEPGSQAAEAMEFNATSREPSEAALPRSSNKMAPPSTRRVQCVEVFSPLVDAPSIGPKTAKRLEKIGLLTIGDFLMAAPATMRDQLDTRWVTIDLLEEWQAQARLVCEIPSLYGYEAQLLVAVNCRSSADLAARDPRGLFARISAIIPTSEGERILRNSKAPQLDDVTNWIEAAQHARPISYRRRVA